jgi:hypothetical protein
MVRDLLEGFVGGSWLSQLDVNTLARVNDSYVSDDLRGRADDIVWRARCGDRYVYLLIEFQSSVEPFMAVRVLTYVGLLYQDLIRAKVIECDRALPPVLPIVLHNGSSRWRAAEEIATLLRDVPEGLEKYSPRLRYLLIDEGSYDDIDLAARHNLVAMLFRMENCRDRTRLAALVNRLGEWLRGAENDSLRRAFGMWLNRVIFARLPGGASGELNNWWEKQTMLSENFDRWEEELRQEGRKAGHVEGRHEGEMALLRRQLRKRFGVVPDWVHNALCDASPGQIEQWGERLLDVASLNELFEGSEVVSPGPPS